jgi:hypothetical protein
MLLLSAVRKAATALDASREKPNKIGRTHVYSVRSGRIEADIGRLAKL